MSEKKKDKKPEPKTILDAVRLEPYAVRFVDSEGFTRAYYAFRNPGGRFFLLDLSRDDIPLAEPIHQPDIYRVEKIKKVPPVGPPKIIEPPMWLEKAINDHIENPPKPEEEEMPDSPPPSAALKAALMGEDDDEEAAGS